MEKVIGMSRFVVMFIGIVIAGGAFAQEGFKIGAYIPLTGWAANYGEDAKRGIELAVEEVNGAGGILGKKVGVLFEDSGGNPKQAVSAVQKLINIDKVPILVGGLFSGEALATGPICQGSKIPSIATQSSHQDVTKPGDYIFRIAPPVTMEYLVLDYAYKVIGARRYSALLFSTDMGRESGKMAEEYFPKLGGKIAKIEFFPTGTTDFKTHLLKMKQENPDVIEVKGGIKEVAQIFKQMQELGIKLPVIGSNMFREPQLWELVGGALKGVAYPTWAPSGAAKARYDKFVATYAKKYGFELKTVTPIFTYEATKLAVYALEKGGNSGPEAQKALAAMKDFPGITGEVTFVKGERKARYCIEKITGPGVFETIDFCTQL